MNASRKDIPDRRRLPIPAVPPSSPIRRTAGPRPAPRSSPRKPPPAPEANEIDLPAGFALGKASAAPETAKGCQRPDAPNAPAEAEKARQQGRQGARQAHAGVGAIGALPAPPDFSAQSHKRFRPKLAKVVALVEGDVDSLAADRHGFIGSSMKARHVPSRSGPPERHKRPDHRQRERSGPARPFPPPRQPFATSARATPGSASGGQGGRLQGGLLPTSPALAAQCWAYATRTRSRRLFLHQLRLLKARSGVEALSKTNLSWLALVIPASMRRALGVHRRIRDAGIAAGLEKTAQRYGRAVFCPQSGFLRTGKRVGGRSDQRAWSAEVARERGAVARRPWPRDRARNRRRRSGRRACGRACAERWGSRRSCPGSASRSDRPRIRLGSRTRRLRRARPPAPQSGRWR